MRMKFIGLFVVSCLLCFSACGDSSSSGAEDADEINVVDSSSSSSLKNFSSCSGIEADSSSGTETDSIKASESISSNASDSNYSSSLSLNSSSATSSSSGNSSGSCSNEANASSSSSTLESSSSGAVKSSSSSSKVATSNSSSKIAWNYLNPNISYGEMIDARDGQVYKTAVIGKRTWMAENLNFAYNEPTSESDSSSFCIENSADSCSKYGRMYFYSAALDSSAIYSDEGKGCGYAIDCSITLPVRGVCPEGWHLPSNDEWNDLYYTAGAKDSAVIKLAALGEWGSSCKSEDSYGFSAIPEGANIAEFWSSTKNEASPQYSANIFSLWDCDPWAGYFNSSDKRGRTHSVRCIEDYEDIESSSSTESSSSAITAWAYLNPDISYGEMTDQRDGHVYKTVVIGNQTWMAENLNYAYREASLSSDSLSFCYNNSEDSCTKYGRLYSWSAAMDSTAKFSDNGKNCGNGVTCAPTEPVRGICPEGWHLPNKEEWSTLYTAVGGETSAGTKLESTSDWAANEWYGPSNCNGDNSFGFTALPAGQIDIDDISSYGATFFGALSFANFWSSTELSSDASSNSQIGCTSIDYSGLRKDAAVSVRCLKD